MSIYIDSTGQLHHPTNHGLALKCPHCQLLTHLTAVSVPQYSVLVSHMPNQVGIGYSCDACQSLVFIKYPVKQYAGNRIELGAQYTELEQPREKFAYNYLPNACELLFKEALTCYSHGAFNAFASMCRRTVQGVFKDLGNNGRLKIFDLLVEVRDIAGVDNDSFNLIKKIMFDNDMDTAEFPTLSAHEAGVLLETMKDMLYQCYVRRGKLQQAMRMRRYFAEERSTNNVTQLKAAT